jgi:hypothetical protein
MLAEGAARIVAPTNVCVEVRAEAGNGREAPKEDRIAALVEET